MKIDESVLSDHYYLDESDACFYLGEYTARKGAGYSETNQIIINIKKCVSRKGMADYKYKEQDIRKVAQMLKDQNFDLSKITFIPVPPSKAKTDPLYDDRLIRILREYDAISSGDVDIRDVVTQEITTEASHNRDDRLKIGELIDLYLVEASECQNPKECIIIFDDVLTTGTHFKAMKAVLEKVFPDTPIYGLFIARRVIPEIDASAAFDFGL